MLKEYIEFTSETRAHLETYQEDVLHMILGMMTETGELADVFKKSLAYNKPIDWVNVQEELGDLMWYIAGFCKICDIDLEVVLHKNMEKLKARYPEKFNSDKANNRDLLKEREILER